MATGCNGTSSKRKLEVLDQDAFLQKSKAARLRRSPEGHFIKAMYSSLVDSIITDPEMMVIPLDDHSIVRGHAVFDTCTLADGKVYRLGIHLDRLFKSAKLAKLKLPFGDSEEENRSRITDIVCQTCVASGLKDAGVRFFLTAGPGNFGFTTAGCEPAFYVSVLTAEKVAEAKGIGEALVPETEVPMKPALLATLKSNNYLLNCMLAIAAQERGGRFGINIRTDGTVAEGCVANCGIVTKDKVFITPPFDGILAGTTVRKAMELAKKHLMGEALKEVRQEILHKDQLFAAQEVIMFCGDLGVFPVTTLDGCTIASGEVGPVGKELKRLIWQVAFEGTEEHIQLTY
ncbi:unnamed protein product [Effrenium voratum]|nr:unnamed protein product [Effrenium voratum]|mmetsp:Transcript_134735/g.319355  ORF Transcript_134735/g.319355 Transcript_134735/m.319355 type:complete len:345 (+) Transcript_134735:39-1073(+)